MPKFTETEKEKIRADLLEHGLELFSRYGLRKTSVEDITRAVNIAKGTFYSFYKTKEELFLSIFTQVNEEMQGRIMGVFTASKKGPRKRLYDALQMQYAFVDENPIFQILMDEEELEQLFRKFPQAGPQLQSFFEDDKYIPFVEQLKEMGIIRKDLKTTHVVGLLKAVFLIHQRKLDFSPEQFEDVFNTYLKLVIDYVALEE